MPTALDGLNRSQRAAVTHSGGPLIDARGKVLIPGLVNTHHHLPQTLTRNVPRVQEAPLFTWLTELYEVGFSSWRKP